MPDLGCVLVVRAANPHPSAAIQVSWNDYIISLKVHPLIRRFNSAGFVSCLSGDRACGLCREAGSVLQSGC